MFASLDAWDPEPLRRALEYGSYTQATLKQLDLGGTAFQGRAAALFRESLPPHSPLKALTRLFMLGDPVPTADLLGTLGAELGPLAELGVLTLADGHVRSNLHLVPYGDGWFASDFLRVMVETPADFVMGLSPVTRLLGSLVPRQNANSLLELGCGAGWLSQQARRTGILATGTDISPRALAFARFNGKLAGLTGIEWLQGSWFEPVAGRRFDRIGCNPPYVQSPGGPLTFRETAPGAEAPCAHILRHLADHLNPGGIACALLNWSHRGASDWMDGPLDWAPVEGLRRWLFQLESQSPVQYTLGNGSDPTRGFPTRLQPPPKWTAGLPTTPPPAPVPFRPAASSSNAASRDRNGPAPTPAASANCPPPPVMKWRAANESWLQSGPSDADLLARHYLVPDGIRAEIGTALGDHGWQDRAIRLTSPGKLSYDGQIDENLMRLLELCRKGLRPADMVAELRPSPQFREIPDLDARIAALTRDLVRFALLTPA